MIKKKRNPRWKKANVKKEKKTEIKSFVKRLTNVKHIYNCIVFTGRNEKKIKKKKVRNNIALKRLQRKIEKNPKQNNLLAFI